MKAFLPGLLFTGLIVSFRRVSAFRSLCPAVFRSDPLRTPPLLSTAAVLEYDDFLPSPNPEFDASEVVKVCMEQLIDGKDGAGLEVCFTFCSDRCRAALGGSLEKFRQYATNPVFGYLVNCRDWSTLSVGSMIEGTATRGAMQTVLMDAIDRDDESRKFLWTLQKERRPPRQGCWIIHEVIYVRNAFQLTL